MLKLLVRLLGFLFFILAPFLLLIRGSVWIHESYDTNGWISIMIGGLLTIILLFIYMSLLRRRVTKKKATATGLKSRLVLSMILVFGFAMHSVLFVSAENVKQRSLQKEFRSLHPILRLSVSTILIIDKKAIMTDAQRVPEDYKRMGLKTQSNSLHYKQHDGFVYAIDLRTNGRSEFRNQLIAVYFRMVGMRTLRHVGTDDHLHISLRNNKKPWAK